VAQRQHDALKTGHTEWIPPASLDTGQHRVNHYHHLQRYLTERTDDDDEPA
jgi:hypothetical protein